MENQQQPRPRVGIPYRTVKEQDMGERGKYEYYLRSILRADGEPVEISLLLSREELADEAASLDAIVLPGSPADVHPSRYRAEPHAKCGWSDPRREYTDFLLLEKAFTEHKPVLAICYGTQSLNVYLGGTLVQHLSAKDPASEVKTTIPHPSSEQPKTMDF